MQVESATLPEREGDLREFTVPEVHELLGIIGNF